MSQEASPRMSARDPDDSLIIDPVAMQIVNRVAAGTRLEGKFQFQDGLLLQGELRGEGQVTGHLLIWPGACLQGRFEVSGDLYVLGQIGATDPKLPAADPHTQVICHGAAVLASSAVCAGHLRARQLRLYDGAVLNGPFMTLSATASPTPVASPEPSPSQPTPHV